MPGLIAFNYSITLPLANCLNTNCSLPHGTTLNHIRKHSARSFKGGFFITLFLGHLCYSTTSYYRTLLSTKQKYSYTVTIIKPKQQQLPCTFDKFLVVIVRHYLRPALKVGSASHKSIRTL